MRKLMSLVVGLGCSTLAFAQNPAQPKLNLTPAGQQNPGVPVATAPATLDPVKNRLDYLLTQWEQKMKGITGLEAAVTRTETDAVDKSVKSFQGVAKFLRPDRALLYLKKTDNPNLYEQYIFTGTFLYEYRPQSKQLRIHEMAPKPGQVFEDSFLNFLFGMKAIEAKQRYNLSLAKEDEHYVYIFVDPINPVDRAEFSKARLVLWKSTFLPRQLEFETPNHDVIKWDIPSANANAKLTAADFSPPQAPKDWQTQRIPRQTAAQGVTPLPQNPNQPPPTKVRPNGG